MSGRRGEQRRPAVHSSDMGAPDGRVRRSPCERKIWNSPLSIRAAVTSVSSFAYRRRRAFDARDASSARRRSFCACAATTNAVNTRASKTETNVMEVRSAAGTSKTSRSRADMMSRTSCVSTRTSSLRMTQQKKSTQRPSDAARPTKPSDSCLYGATCSWITRKMMQMRVAIVTCTKEPGSTTTATPTSRKRRAISKTSQKQKSPVYS